MLRSMDFIHVSEPASRPKNSVERSLAEFERGETTVCDTFEDYLRSIEAATTGCRECHIQPDWLLIYRIKERLEILNLVDTGTHSDLFGKNKR